MLSEEIHFLSKNVVFIGPDLSEGPMPAVFYFSLSAKDSLCLDPFNQFPLYLATYPVRIFSITLPGHEEGLSPYHALHVWAKTLSQGTPLIEHFITQVEETIHFLQSKNALIPTQMAIAGLSRGAFIATHVAAKIPLFQYVVGFAPLTTLKTVKEFQSFAPSTIASLSLTQLIPHLTHHHLRFFMGNVDTKVGTRECFDFIENLSLHAHKEGIRSPCVELLISPSIGKDGHGTSKDIFHEGARWTLKKLGICHDV